VGIKKSKKIISIPDKHLQIQAFKNHAENQQGCAKKSNVEGTEKIKGEDIWLLIAGFLEETNCRRILLNG
jgi:hypothetical protein